MDAEIVNRRTEEHRREAAGEKLFQIKLVRGGLHQFDFVAQLLDFQGKAFGQNRVVDTFDDFKFVRQFFAAGFKQVNFVIENVIYAFEVFAHADRPGNGCAADFQNIFHFVEQFQRIAHFAVVFVHKGNDGRVAQAADA